MTAPSSRHPFDAIVVGAGPAGSTAAAGLARRGLRVLLLEQGPAPGTRVACGGGMPWPLVRRLRIEESVDARIHALHLGSPGNEIRLRSRIPLCAAMPRPVFDRILAERAVAAGATLACNTSALRLRPGPPVSVDLRGPEGDATLSAPLVVLADGPSTLARRDLGFGFDRERQLTAYALKMRVVADGVDFPPDLFDFRLDARRMFFGYFWIFPKRDYLNIGIGTLLQERRQGLDELLFEFAAQAGLDRSRLRVIERKGGLIPLEPARRWVTDGALVVGDAAGLVNGLTGGGLVYAVRSGELAAEAGAAALRDGDTSAASLERYPRRFLLTRHWWFLQATRLALRAIWAGHGRFPSAYERVFRGYFRLSPLFSRVREV